MICLTLDIDWAPDEVIRDSLALIAQYNVKTTWFVTHETPVLAEIRATPGHELGLHPNFNPLLDGSGETAETIFRNLHQVVPEARSVRSHSLTRSSRLSVLFASMGMTHESNVFIHPRSATSLSPWRCSAGLVQIPILWEDDVRLSDVTLGEPTDWFGKANILTFDFHPIHIFSNTRTMNDYEAIRRHYHDADALRTARYPPETGGSRDRLLALLAHAVATDAEHCLVSEISNAP